MTASVVAVIPTLSVVGAADLSAGRVVVPRLGAALPAALGVVGPFLEALDPSPQD
jgi:hypothetical protein